MSRGNRLEVYLDRDKHWRWRMVSNGHVMADSGQGYRNRVDCIAGAAVVTSASLDGVLVRILPRLMVDPVPVDVDGTDD